MQKPCLGEHIRDAHFKGVLKEDSLYNNNYSQNPSRVCVCVWLGQGVFLTTKQPDALLIRHVIASHVVTHVVCCLLVMCSVFTAGCMLIELLP